jgi:hypothetical protein
MTDSSNPFDTVQAAPPLLSQKSEPDITPTNPFGAIIAPVRAATAPASPTIVAVGELKYLPEEEYANFHQGNQDLRARLAHLPDSDAATANAIAVDCLRQIEETLKSVALRNTGPVKLKKNGKEFRMNGIGAYIQECDELKAVVPPALMQKLHTVKNLRNTTAHESGVQLTKKKAVDLCIIFDQLLEIAGGPFAKALRFVQERMVSPPSTPQKKERCSWESGQWSRGRRWERIQWG